MQTRIDTIAQIKPYSIIIDSRTDKLLRVERCFYNVYARPRMTVDYYGLKETIDFEPNRFYLVWEVEDK